MKTIGRSKVVSAMKYVSSGEIQHVGYHESYAQIVGYVPEEDGGASIVLIEPIPELEGLTGYESCRQVINSKEGDKR